MRRWFERFCYKYERYGVRNLMPILVIGQAVVAITWLMNAWQVVDFLMFDPSRILAGEVWRLVTFLFVPDVYSLLTGNILTLLLSLYVFWWMGRALENEWGRMKFTVYYFTGVLFMIAFGLIFKTSVSTLSLNLSLFFALATLYPERKILLFFVLPIKFKYLAAAEAVLYVLLPLFQLPLAWGNLLTLVPILNYLLFFSPQLVSLLRSLTRRRGRAVEFKTEVRRTRERRGYVHQCAVCGVTDADAPDREFRYCSLCAGYKCYCSEHIFNHVHSTMQ